MGKKMSRLPDLDVEVAPCGCAEAVLHVPVVVVVIGAIVINPPDLSRVN